MSWPLGLSGAGALAAALAIGVAFGFVLERAGLGDPKKLLGLFYLEDFTMLNVPKRIEKVGDLWMPLLAARGRFNLSTFV